MVKVGSIYFSRYTLYGRTNRVRVGQIVSEFDFLWLFKQKI